MGADASSQDEVGNNGMLAKPTFLCVIVAVACAAGGIASTQTFPNRPIRIVVGFAPAGPADVMARLIGQRLTSILGQSIVIDNRPGAGGTIGARAVAESHPDGYTLLLGNTSTLVISPLIYKNVNYDPVKGFAPVAALGITSNLMIVNPALPVKSVQELIALARAKPGKLNYASAGIGTPPHLYDATVRFVTCWCPVGRAAHGGALMAGHAVIDAECPSNGPRRTLTLSPRCSGRRGSSTRPLRSRCRIAAIAGSDSRAGAAPLSTKRTTPGAQRALCHCRWMCRKQ